MEKISGGWLRNFFRPNSPNAPRAQPKTAKPASPFHAVSVIPGEGACGAAYRLTGHRFLSKEAPTLPLPTCDAFHCTCRFAHHADRRAGPRRRIDFGLMPSQFPGNDRRRSTGRRSTDI